jgi:hypothetical protein
MTYHNPKQDFLVLANRLGSITDGCIRQLRFSPKWHEDARRVTVAARQQLRELEMILEQEAVESFK